MRSRRIFIEELLEELGNRGLDNIPIIGAYTDKRRASSLNLITAGAGEGGLVSSV